MDNELIVAFYQCFIELSISIPILLLPEYSLFHDMKLFVLCNPSNVAGQQSRFEV